MKETRRFEVTVEIPARWQDRERVPARKVTAVVELTVNWDWLLWDIGHAAIRNKTGRSSGMAKGVTAKVVEILKEERGS